MPKRSRHRLAGRIEIDADDLVGADHARALDHVEADAAQAEHDDIGARLDLGGVDHRADAGGHAAADVADLVERRVLADLGQRDLRQHGVVGEGRAAHVVVDRLAADARSGWCRPASAPLPWVARMAVHRLVLRDRQRFALPAFRRVERDDVVAGFDAGDARADLQHHARALVAEDGGEQALRIARPSRVNSSVWQTPVALISTSTSPARGPSRSTSSISSGFVGFEGDGGAGLHGRSCGRRRNAGTMACSSLAVRPRRPSNSWPPRGGRLRSRKPNARGVL